MKEITMKKTTPTKPCYVPGHQECWVCSKPVPVNLFSEDKEVCMACFIDDLKAQIDELKKPKVVKKSPGRPKKEVNDEQTND